MVGRGTRRGTFSGRTICPAPNEFQLIASIVEICGPIPGRMVEASPQRAEFFERTGRLRSVERICRKHRRPIEPAENYYTTEMLRERIFDYTVAIGNTRPEVAAERARRALLAHFIEAALRIDPAERITAADAMNHPFLTAQF